MDKQLLEQDFYRWVKASERLPERGWKGNLRIGYDTGFPHYSSGAFELDTIKVDIWSHPYAEKDYLKHIEWLEKVEANQQELWGECWNNPKNHKFAEGEDDIAGEYHDANKIPEMLPTIAFILDKSDSVDIEGRKYYHRSVVINAMAEYASQPTPPQEGQDELDYWKQRCEAAEDVIEVERTRASAERLGDRSGIESAYDKWQQLKQSNPLKDDLPNQ